MYDRDALLAAVDLVGLADELLGAHSGSQRSPMWHCPNPQHAQTGRTPPLSVFHSHQGEQRWRCHGCGEGGSAIDLVVACRGGTVREALDYQVNGATTFSAAVTAPALLALVAVEDAERRGPAGLCMLGVWAVPHRGTLGA